MPAARKIAYVEDSVDNAEMFSHFLNHLCDDLEVCSFRDGAAFLETLRPGMYRVVILDISLPEMDGYEVLRRMRSIDGTVPAIAFTAHAAAKDRQMAIQAGFSEVVTKPVHDMEAFCRMVVAHVDASMT